MVDLPVCASALRSVSCRNSVGQGVVYLCILELLGTVDRSSLVVTDHGDLLGERISELPPTRTLFVLPTDQE
jgi:hypothetical protein